jgi:predicted amidohydrolase
MLRTAIVQTDPKFGEVSANLKDASELISSVSADLYVLPELFNTGYNFLDGTEAETLAESADGETFRTIAQIAKKKGAYIVYGFAEKADRLYNAAALVGPDGMAGLYRKVHLYYRETLYFTPGDLGFPVFDLPWGKLGIMICFDWIYPESVRTLALKGAQVIAHPSNLVLPHCPNSMVTRCLENRVFAMTADRVGREERGGTDLTYIGMSEIVSPLGDVLVRMDGRERGIRIVEIEPDIALDKKLNRYNDIMSGRRPDQYMT